MCEEKLVGNVTRTDPVELKAVDVPPSTLKDALGAPYEAGFSIVPYTAIIEPGESHVRTLLCVISIEMVTNHEKYMKVYLQQRPNGERWNCIPCY